MDASARPTTPPRPEAIEDRLGDGSAARSDQSRAEAEELLLHEVKGAHAVLRASEDECAFDRGEEHPGEVGRLRPVNASGFKQFGEVRDPDLEDLSRRSPSRL